MALSFIVTGTAWKWFLDPGIGLEHIMHQWGWESFEFDWIKNRTFAIYTVVIAAVWQSSGFVMAMFLAGLRGIDGEIMKAAQIDGASGFRMYRRIIIPLLRPAFLSAFVILAHLSIKAYDLVIALTNGGPGRATEVPATFRPEYRADCGSFCPRHPETHDNSASAQAVGRLWLPYRHIRCPPAPLARYRSRR